MDKTTLLNRLDMIKANCEINKGEPFTKKMLEIIAETMKEAKKIIEKTDE